MSAYLLAREHDVTVFEAADRLGGHTHTHIVDLGAGPVAIDTGFIVFNYRTYPSFTRLLAKLGVRSQASEMSFSVQCARTGLEWASRAVFVQRKNLLRPRFLRMLADIVRFYHSGPKLLQRPGDELTMRDYVRQARLSDGFVDHYLVPLGASIWSCPPEQFFDFPVRFMLGFMRNHGMLQLTELPTWRVIAGGSQRYVEALVREFRGHIRLATPIAAVRRHQSHVEIAPQGADSERFDHVVIACHSDQALSLLDDPTDTERELLGAIPYQENHVVLHTDTSILPSDRRAWSSWNYYIPPEQRQRAVLSYGMNILQGVDAPQFACATVNDADRIDPNLVLRRIRYHHPLFTIDAPRAQARHAELIGANRSSYCGAYWGYGFHEDGVKSALAVAHHFGISL